MITNLQPWLTGTLLPNLNTATIAAIANNPNTIAFINALLPQLNATSMAGIVSTSVAWLNSVVTNVTPATVNSMIFGLTPWITGTLLPGLNTANIAAIANHPNTIAFLNALLPQLNAASMAGHRQHQLELDGDVVSVSPPATVNCLLTDIGPWLLGSLMPSLDEHIIANLVNHPNTVALSTACCRTWMRPP